MSTRTRKNRKNLYLWIIVTVLAVALITGYYDGRADKEDTSETVIEP